MPKAPKATPPPKKAAPKGAAKKPSPATGAAKKPSPATGAAKKVPAKAAPAKAAPAKAAAAKREPAKAKPAGAKREPSTPKAKSAPKAEPARKAPQSPAGPAKSAAPRLTSPKKAAPSATTVKAVAAGTAAPGPAKPEATAPGPVKKAAPVPSAADAKFFEEQRTLLLQERESYAHQAASLKAEADQLAAEMEPGDVQFDEESGEGDSIGMERERDLQLAGQARAAIEEIDRALTKIEARTYGICERCALPIPKARLKALPYAALCVACKSGGLSSRR